MAASASLQVEIGRVRARGAGLDPLRARLATERVLSGSLDAPLGLPPSAILCIRSLRDPRPGTIDLRVANGNGEAAWARDLRARLDQAARSAVRPLHGPVPASADAVWFADRAEMIALLARDWCDGTVSAGWWWQQIVGRSAEVEIVRIWTEEPDQIPAAFTHLTRLGYAGSFLNILPDREVRALLGAIIQSYGLPASWMRMAAPGNLAALSFEGSEPIDAQGIRRSIQSAFTGLDPLRATTLDLGLSLWRSPSEILSETVRPSMESPRSIVTDRATGRSTSPGVDEGKQHYDGVDGAEALRSAPLLQRRSNADTVQPEGADRSTLWPRVDQSGLDAPAGNDEPGAGHFGIGVRPTSPGAGTPGFSGITPDGLTADTEDGVELSFAIDSAFGGVFYLINVAINLALYADFSRPAEPGIPLSPWDFLALIGERLVGSEFRSDPVSSLLARLADRADGIEPGSGANPPGWWRLPDAWVLALGEPPCEPLADLEDDLATWCDWLASIIRRRLAMSLGVDQAEAGSELCRRTARIWVTSTTVDISFALENHPTSIRLAGLDRDPGWMPAAGRTISFHFD